MSLIEKIRPLVTPDDAGQAGVRATYIRQTKDGEDAPARIQTAFLPIYPLRVSVDSVDNHECAVTEHIHFHWAKVDDLLFDEEFSEADEMAEIVADINAQALEEILAGDLPCEMRDILLDIQSETLSANDVEYEREAFLPEDGDTLSYCFGNESRTYRVTGFTYEDELKTVVRIESELVSSHLFDNETF